MTKKVLAFLNSGATIKKGCMNLCNRAPLVLLVAMLASPPRSPNWIFQEAGTRNLGGRTGAHPRTDLVDFLGIPINAEARQWAQSWDPDRLTLPEHQCQVHTVAYIYRGPLALRIWEERDPQTQELIAIHNYTSTYEQNRTIWMDNRPHPPEYAPHTWMGFSTGHWDGNVFTVYTTHIKQGWHRRNGIPSSDMITLTEHFIRHGDHLTHVSVVTDPDLSVRAAGQEPGLRAEHSSNGNWLWPCEYVDEAPGRQQGEVPSFMPGENPFMTEFAAKYGIPAEAVLGGARDDVSGI